MCCLFKLLGLAAASRTNAAIRMGDAEKTVAEMMKPEAQLAEVYAFAANLYPKEHGHKAMMSVMPSDVCELIWITKSALSVSLNVPVLSVGRTALMLSLF